MAGGERSWEAGAALVLVVEPGAAAPVDEMVQPLHPGLTTRRGSTRQLWTIRHDFVTSFGDGTCLATGLGSGGLVRFGRVFARLDDACFVGGTTACTRSRRPSFIRIRATCVFTVVSERKSSFAISAFDLLALRVIVSLFGNRQRRCTGGVRADARDRNDARCRHDAQAGTSHDSARSDDDFAARSRDGTARRDRSCGTRYKRFAHLGADLSVPVLSLATFILVSLIVG
jgi:hypothetical protein